MDFKHTLEFELKKKNKKFPTAILNKDVKFINSIQDDKVVK